MTASVDYVLSAVDAAVAGATTTGDVAYVMEYRTGLLVAVSEGRRVDADGKRATPYESDVPAIVASSTYLAQNRRNRDALGEAWVMEVTGDDGVLLKYWSVGLPVVTDHVGIDWVLVYMEPVDCGDDSYLPDTETFESCERCVYPAKTASPRTPGVYACDACEPGYYVVFNGGGYACKECPHGGVCEGGTVQP